MGTGIITTVIVLIISYMIISRVVGFAFRLVVPLVLIVLLGGAGVVLELIPGQSPEFYPADQETSYRSTQPRSIEEIGDLRLRDLADMAVRAARSVLEGSLALLDSIVEPELSRTPSRPIEPRHPSRGEDREVPPDMHSDWSRVGRQERW